MQDMKIYLLAALVLLGSMLGPVLGAKSVAAQAAPPPREQLEDAAKAMEEAAQNLSSRLGPGTRAIPQFEAPGVLENGDILIRRARPDGSDTPDPEADPSPNESQT